MSAAASYRDYSSQAKKAVQKMAFRSTYEVGLAVAGQAQELCAVDTARLKGSITATSQSEKSKIISPATEADRVSVPLNNDTVRVGTAVDYGPHIEFGTRKMREQAFLRPAVDLIAKGKAAEEVFRDNQYIVDQEMK